MTLSGETYSRAPILLPETSCAAFLVETASHAPEKIAFIDNELKWSFRDLLNAANIAASALKAAGVGHGDRVIVSLPTSVDYFVWVFATLFLGAVVVPVYENAPPSEFTGRVKQSGSRHAVVSNADSRQTDAASGIQFIAADAFKNFEGNTFGPVSVATNDIAFLFYSSGSTGEPKAIPLTHRNILAGRLTFAQATLLSERDVLVHFLPPVHVYGWMAITAALGAGATVVLHRRYDLDAIVNDVERFRATAIFGVPRLIVDLTQLPAERVKSIVSLRFVNTGSAPLAAEIMVEMNQRTGILVTCGYGLTEAAPTSHATVDRPELIDLATVGCPTSLITVKLINPSDPERPIAAGEAGELAIAGPQVAHGYLRPDGTLDRSAWLKDGFFRTGDLVEIDRIGRLRIVGRLKSLIKYNGYSIVPAELESILASHPGVRDCAVLGRPDPVAGEIPIAFVVAKSVKHVTTDDLLTHVRNSVSAQRSPREIIFVDAIPRSEAGKVVASELLARK